MDMLKMANEQFSLLERDYRYLHSHAEVGFDLAETVTYVEKQLKELGLTPQRCGKCGITATIGNPESAHCVLLRADMDALPIEEQSGLDFCCTTGNMHACGHDAHTAMLIGAARLLKAEEENLNGCVKLMFQPAEEILEGAKNMIDSGVLEAPAPSVAFMLHVIPNLPLSAGTVIIPPAGEIAPSADFFTITITGKGCHGSSPAEGTDPLVCASNLLLALLEIPARELTPSQKAVLTIGSLCGGNTANAIPDKAVMKGTLRAFDENVRKIIRHRITEMTRSISTAYRTTADVVFDSGCPTLINSEELCSFAKAHLESFVGKEKYTTPAGQSASGGISTGGSEDFAYVSREVPSLMLALAAGEPQKGYNHSLHHPQVTFDTSALPYGSAVLAGLAAEWLKSHAV